MIIYPFVGIWIIKILAGITSLVIISELFYWAFYWVQRKSPPQKVLWQIITKATAFCSGIDSEEIDTILHLLFLIIFMLIGVIIALTWPILLPCLLLIGTVYLTRWLVDQYKKKNKPSF